MSQSSAGAGDRILVVDDEADIIALVAYHLVKQGYRVSTASDGIEAIMRSWVGKTPGRSPFHVRIG